VLFRSLAAIGKWIRSIHAQRDKAAAHLEGSDHFLLKSILGHRVASLAAEMAEEKSQRFKMSAGLDVIVDRIVAQIFRGAGVDEERTCLHRRLNEAEHRAPIFSSGYLGKHFAAPPAAHGN